MRIAIKSQGAGWVIDQIKSDFKKFSKHEVVGVGSKPDIFWCLSPFAFPQSLPHIPNGCLKVVHIHHINEDQLEAYDFRAYNNADLCIVPNKITEGVVRKHLYIPVRRMPYWLLSPSMQSSNEAVVKEIRDELGKGILVGSFQKDGNGKEGDAPKHSKNPELLVKVLSNLAKTHPIKVLLAGYARNYVVQSLKKAGVPFVYKKKFKSISTLYDCVDWYIVTSRYEGGPQAVLEASYRKTNILSTPVGLAPEVLHPDCLCSTTNEFVDGFENTNRVEENHKAVQNYLPETLIPIWDRFFEEYL